MNTAADPDHGPRRVAFRVNGARHEVAVGSRPDRRLIDLLRDDLGRTIARVATWRTLARALAV